MKKQSKKNKKNWTKPGINEMDVKRVTKQQGPLGKNDTLNEGDYPQTAS